MERNMDKDFVAFFGMLFAAILLAIIIGFSFNAYHQSAKRDMYNSCMEDQRNITVDLECSWIVR